MTPCRKISPPLAVHVRCHQGKCPPSALLKLCSVLPYFYIFHPLTSTKSLFLPSASQITAFLPNFLSSSSQPLCEGSSVLRGIKPVLKESICRQAPKRVSERKHCTQYFTPIFPVPSSSQEILSLPSPHPSPASAGQGCCVILTSLPLETEFLCTKCKV